MEKIYQSLTDLYLQIENDRQLLSYFCKEIELAFRRLENRRIKEEYIKEQELIETTNRDTVEINLEDVDDLIAKAQRVFLHPTTTVESKLLNKNRSSELKLPNKNQTSKSNSNVSTNSRPISIKSNTLVKSKMVNKTPLPTGKYQTITKSKSVCGVRKTETIMKPRVQSTVSRSKTNSSVFFPIVNSNTKMLNKNPSKVTNKLIANKVKQPLKGELPKGVCSGVKDDETHAKFINMNHVSKKSDGSKKSDNNVNENESESNIGNNNNYKRKDNIGNMFDESYLEKYHKVQKIKSRIKKRSQDTLYKKEKKENEEKFMLHFEAKKDPMQFYLTDFKPEELSPHDGSLIRDFMAVKKMLEDSSVNTIYSELLNKNYNFDDIHSFSDLYHCNYLNFHKTYLENLRTEFEVVVNNEDVDMQQIRHMMSLLTKDKFPVIVDDFNEDDEET